MYDRSRVQMTSPFDFVQSISYTKKDLLEEVPESTYNPFIVNRSLSYFVDLIHYANEMNMHPNLPKKLQYDYLRKSIRKNKRFAKWHKIEPVEDIKIIQEYYQCNYNKAKEFFALLTEDQLNNIKASFSKGGN